MNLEEFVKETGVSKMRPRIVCVDGFFMSVQGSVGHYCSPRKDADEFTSMEIGFPSQDEELIASLAENKTALTETVYGWVPCELIQQVIDKHGGIDKAKTFKK
jgi:hypothetical protein